MNDDLLPERADIDTSLAAIHREHEERLAAVMDLDAGLAAILTPDEDADRDEATTASSHADMPLSGGQAAIIIATRSRVLNLIRASDLALARAQGLADTLASARDPICLTCGTKFEPEDLTCSGCGANASGPNDDILAHASELAVALARASDLASDLADAQGLAATLASALADARGLVLDCARARGLDCARANDFDLARANDFDLARAQDLQSALSRAVGELAHRFNAVEVDASGADLSALDLTDMSVLEGVLWTEETTWPPHMCEQVRLRSREIRPGVYQVQGGSERDPSELIVTR